MYKIIALLLVVPALVLGQTPVRQCASGGDQRPTSVYFGRSRDPATLRQDHCRSEPCDLSRTGVEGSTLVEFTSNANTNTIVPGIRARVFGIWITQDPPREILDNPCAILSPEGHSCPLVQGNNYSYVLTIPIDASTPLLTTETEVTLRDGSGNVIFCYAVENRVVN